MLFCMKVLKPLDPCAYLLKWSHVDIYIYIYIYAPGEVILKHQICSEEAVRFNQGTFLRVYNRTANSHDSSLISLTIL